MAGVCGKQGGCYAMQGTYTWGNVSKKFEERLDLSRSKYFVEIIDAEIKRRKVEIVRIHDSGDFYSMEYLNKWVQIAYDNPTVRFYAYTKSFKFFNGRKLPDNFDVIYSNGSKLDHTVKFSDHRHTGIFNDLISLKAAKYVDASKFDLYATKWFSKSKKVGLIYH